ncbi:tetratricopeptide repeat protein [Sphingomonas sp.]|uniref:tetratricopeptide repeat protein n=1 Tax=Sphingomonas sp. TaxID=28214 RepID=UPI00179FC929|nr:tetratricopeptide repeat protein [Sphingomonas sp.]MBA3511557.1 tetratricopeptide repeat protein [Sphingomonas sp.]
MKAFLLSATAIAFLAAATPAQGGRITLGSSLARSCYEAAEALRADRGTLQTCDLALAEEGLSHHDLTGTHVNRGVILMLLGNLDMAERDYDRALALDANEAEAWLNKGINALKRGNSQLALQFVERAIALRTRRPAVAFYMRAIAHEEAGNLRAAYGDLQRARRLDPTWPLPAVELQRYQVRTR